MAIMAIVLVYLAAQVPIVMFLHLIEEPMGAACMYCIV